MNLTESHSQNELVPKFNLKLCP